jgi:DNA-binding response OmpR family regulator
MNQNRVLVVEDDPAMQWLLQSQLAARGFEVQVVDNGLEALTAVADNEPSLVLLDISLPGLDGLEVCRRLRKWSSVPVIFVTASDTLPAKVTALEFGDDYLTKPFPMDELLARIRAVLDRARAGSLPPPELIEVDDLVIDLKQREVRRGGEPIALSGPEFALLRELVTYADKVLTFEYLLDAVRGQGDADLHLVHLHVLRLRRKLDPGPLGPRYILTIPGVGYRFRLRA